MPLGSEEAQAESLLWFLGNGGGYVNSAGKYDINSAQNVATLKFMSQLVKAGDTQPSPGTHRPQGRLGPVRPGKIGMVLGSPAVIPIIQAGGRAEGRRLRHRRRPGQDRPAASPRSACTTTSSPSTPAATKAAIKKFLDFVYQDKYQLQFDNEYDLLPATQQRRASDGPATRCSRRSSRTSRSR